MSPIVDAVVLSSARTKHTWLSQSVTVANASTSRCRRSIRSVRSTSSVRTTKIAPGEAVADGRVRERLETLSRMYFVTLRLSAQSRTVASSMSSTDVGRRIVRPIRAAGAAPARSRGREAGRRRWRPSSRFAAGLAGLGWVMQPISPARAPTATRTRVSAKRPTPTTSCGRSILHDPRERRVARSEELGALARRKLVRSPVPARCLHEHERAPVRHEHPVEEPLGRSEPVSRPAPEPCAAHFRTRAREAGDGSKRMLCRRLPDGAGDADEVANHRDVSERHARLRHAERPGIHADHDDLARRACPPALEVRLVRHPRVDERVVDERHRRKGEGVDACRQLRADRDQRSHAGSPSRPERCDGSRRG